MKKTLALVLTLIFIISNLSFSASAKEKGGNIYGGIITEIEYLDDGSYIVTYLEDSIIIQGGDSPQSTTVSKAKTKRFFDSSDNLVWSVRVKGTFQYDGTTSTCTKSEGTANSYNPIWSIISYSASKSGSTATATATARKTVGNSYTDYTRSVSLTCSPTGSFS